MTDEEENATASGKKWVPQHLPTRQQTPLQISEVSPVSRRSSRVNREGWLVITIPGKAGQVGFFVNISPST